MFGMYGGAPSGTFEARYRAMPVAFIEQATAEFGDKVILPPSALDRLASLHIEYPMLFKVEGVQSKRSTHCGVLQFTAEEGVVYMPHWMMQNMLLQVGDMVSLRNVSLPKGQYVKLQPVTSDFLDISNPKAVLERALRTYTCLTVGDCFVVNYNNKNYEIEVRECRPGSAISVVETDCQVDFEAPKDYKEPERVPPKQAAAAPSGGGAGGSQAAGPSAGGQAGTSTSKPGDDKKAANGTNGTAAPGKEEAPADGTGTQTFLAFAGTARRLDGRAVGVSQPVPVTLGRPGATLASTSGQPSTSGQSPNPSSASSSAGGGAAAPGGKAGTFVSTGNRLLDKLAKEQAAKSSGAAPAPAPAAPAAPANGSKPAGEEAAGDKEGGEGGSGFKAFAGKGYSLK